MKVYTKQDLQGNSVNRLKIKSMLEKASLKRFLSKSACHLLINMLSHNFSAPNYDCRCLKTLAESLFCTTRTITNARSELIKNNLITLHGYTSNAVPKYDINPEGIIKLIKLLEINKIKINKTVHSKELITEKISSDKESEFTNSYAI